MFTGATMLAMVTDRLKALLPWRVRNAGQVLRRRAEDAALSLITHKIPLPASVAHKQLHFLGASVGLDWRLHLVFPNIRTFTAYQFDKAQLVADSLTGSMPDGVIIKECAAYFPSDEQGRELLVRGWIRGLRDAGIRAALATVVPVTAEHAAAAPGRAEGLWAFNDWAREFCQDEGVPLLDLEAALRVSAEDRHLDPALHCGDGLHLSQRAYRRHVDLLIPPLLLRMFTDE